ncbi:hypothetical protein [Streptomyces sp. NPDC088785]|uniref:hypothetical protein n=1 Tax=Streptomyces sp. NPDC088785 TaxID=3365897 RepID=UPI003811041D
MTTSERDVETRAAAPLPRAGRDVVRGVSMADLLASCAAARLVSAPPAPDSRQDPARGPGDVRVALRAPRQ